MLYATHQSVGIIVDSAFWLPQVSCYEHLRTSFVWMFVLFFGYIPKMKMVGLYRNSLFYCMKNYLTAFQAAAAFTFLPARMRFQFLHVFTSVYYCLSLKEIITTVVDVKGISHCFSFETNTVTCCWIQHANI